MYRVVTNFRDIQDNMYLYRAGDRFPRQGKYASAERIAALSSMKNKAKRVLIERIEVVDPDEEVKEEKKAAKPAKKNREKKQKEGVKHGPFDGIEN